jgi:hypothetical protein
MGDGGKERMNAQASMKYQSLRRSSDEARIEGILRSALISTRLQPGGTLRRERKNRFNGFTLVCEVVT